MPGAEYWERTLPGPTRQAIEALSSPGGWGPRHESPPQAVGGDATHHGGGGTDKRPQGADGIAQAAQRLVPVEPLAAGGRPLPAREPRLEVHVPDLQPSLRPVALGVDAPDELPVMQDGQGVVAVHALVARSIDLDAVVEAEQTRHAAAIPEEG